MATVDFKNAVLVINDGTAVTPKTFTVVFGEGSFTWTEARELIYDKNRGKLDNVRLGDEIPLELSLVGRWEFLIASTGDNVQLVDVLDQSGEADDWVSTDADLCAPYAVDLKLTYTPICATEDTEVNVFPDFRWEKRDFAIKDGQISISGKCNVTKSTKTRVAQA